mmetsp:Transcript_3668/g.11372  ORF Transcript_3668/g.11372 Transcript_3668/m.11372 type:complete len:485 (+) Transcript_3668:123-1577(+)
MRRLRRGSATPGQLPARLREARERAEAARKELEHGRAVLTAWLSAVARIKAVGSLLDEQRADAEAAALGDALISVVGANSAIELFRQAEAAIKDKLQWIDGILTRCREVEKLIGNRDRLRRKRDESRVKLERQRVHVPPTDVRFHLEAEEAQMAYLKAVCVLEAELEYVKLKASQGMCKDEYALIKAYSREVFPICYHTDSVKPLASEDFTARHAEFKAEQFAFVERKRVELLQARLSEQKLVMPMARVAAEKPSQPSGAAGQVNTAGTANASTAEAQTPAPSTFANVRITRAGAVPLPEASALPNLHSAPKLPTRPKARRGSDPSVQFRDDSPASESPSPLARRLDDLRLEYSPGSAGSSYSHIETRKIIGRRSTTENEPEVDFRKLSLRNVSPGPEAFSDTEHAATRSSIELTDQDDGLVSDGASSPGSSFSPGTPEMVDEMRNKGFFVGRNGTWEEYVDRGTGDTFWLEPNTYQIATQQPQ